MISAPRLFVVVLATGLLAAVPARADLRFSMSSQRIPAEFCSDLVQLQTDVDVSAPVPIYLLANVVLYADAKCTVPLVDPACRAAMRSGSISEARPRAGA